MISFKSVLLCALSLLAIASESEAQAPLLINFQAQIEGATSSTASVVFTLYDTASGGTALWSESYPNLNVQNGRIQVLLGSNTALPASIFETDGERYLAFTVNGETLSPRSRLTSAAYALRAAFADRVTSGGITTINAGEGILVTGNNGPTAEISVDSDVTLGPGGHLEVTNGSGQSAVEVGGGDTGGAILVKEQPGNYNAVELSTRSSNSNRLGGQIFVRGNNDFAAIHMFSDGDTDGGRIVLREPPGNQSMVLTATDGAGRLVILDGSDVVISLRGNTGNMLTKGKVGIGFSGDLNSQDPSFDLDVIGDARITGNLSKGGGSFTIDHPLDPLNKTLSHSFVESPEMMNVYNGNVELDASGEAWIQLPDWFDALNRDFRYQLTCIGGFAPVYVEQTIKENRFKIAGGTPGLEVSWQVTGIRKDPYAELHRIQIEEEKSAAEKGRYLHPDAFGVSPTEK